MNISEFAKIAGVSKSAVSRYFNNGYLSEEKIALIKAAVDKTGYAPSLSARSVKNKVTKLVGVIIPKLSSESIARITEGISEVLNEQGYKLLLVNTANDYNKEIDSLELLRNNWVDGIILMASVFTKLHKTVLDKIRVPVVILGQNYKGYNCVCHDDFGAAYSLTRLMIDKGASDLACVGVRMDDMATGKFRFDGFMKALNESGLTLHRGNHETADFTSESGYDHARRLFSGKSRPDAVFCATDSIAAGVVLYCKENGIRIPQDVMVCGIGDSRLSRLTSTTITSAHLHYKTAGIEAANMLLSQVDRGKSAPRILQLGYEVVERESTDR